MSLYKKAWIFTIWAVAVLFAFPYWMPFFDKVFGSVGILVSLFFWLGHGFIAMCCFNCPDCDLSVFRGSKGFISSYSPWPRRRCGHCGRDHTQADSTAQR